MLHWFLQKSTTYFHQKSNPNFFITRNDLNCYIITLLPEKIPLPLKQNFCLPFPFSSEIHSLLELQPDWQLRESKKNLDMRKKVHVLNVNELWKIVKVFMLVEFFKIKKTISLHIAIVTWEISKKTKGIVTFDKLVFFVNVFNNLCSFGVPFASYWSPSFFTWFYLSLVLPSSTTREERQFLNESSIFSNWSSEIFLIDIVGVAKLMFLSVPEPKIKSFAFPS